MATIQAGDMADLVTITLRELGKLQFTDLMSDYNDTIALKRLMRKGKMTFDSGYEVQFNVITDHSNSASFVGLYEQDVLNATNVMTTGTVPWRHITWNWIMDDREEAFNRAPSKIVDLIKTRRIAAFGSAVIKFEYAFWRVPATTDTKSPYGLPYYVVKSNTAATQANNNGFNGTVPSGYTTVAGINPTTYDRWRNYATQYTAVTHDDFVRKARRMAHYTEWKPLVDEIPEYGPGMDRGYYTNYSVLATLEELLESQNENLGSDVASMDGKVTFRRTPVTPVIELDQDSTNPFYQIDWKEFGTMGLRGKWMKETSIPHVADHHNVSATHTDCSFNFLCRNRRKQGVLATDTTMGY